MNLLIWVYDVFIYLQGFFTKINLNFLKNQDA